jgi:hypothetical protein
MVEATALLLTALLFGGMTLFAAGFAGVLYQSLPKPTVGRVLRETFPRFYGFVIAAAAVSGALVWFRDGLGATALAGIAVTALGARQVLTPAINRATDSGQTRRFNWLHGVAVALTMGHIVLAGWVVVRFLD